MREHEATIVEQLEAALGDEVQAIYLFGSRGRNDARTDRDWDVALLSSRRLDAVERWHLQERIASALGSNVDLVDLRTASAVMRVQVLKDGRLLADPQPQRRAEFEVFALSDYARLQEERREILADASRPGWLDG